MISVKKKSKAKFWDLKNPNDFVEASNALKTYGYPNPESIRIIRIE